jgi:hypothetical protein
VLHRQEIGGHAAWRWCFFLAGLVPLSLVCDVITYGAISIMEMHFFTRNQLLYYIVSIKVCGKSKPLGCRRGEARFLNHH